MTGITRRQAAATALAGGAALSMPWVRRANAAGELRIFGWEGYTDKPWVEAFEKATGAKLSLTYAGSVDEMFAKMQGSGGADFDVLAFDTGSFERYVEQKLIQPLDLAKLPNRKNLAPAFQDVKEIVFDGAVMGVPFAWGSLPLVYDKDQFPDGAPDSWGVLWDSANNCIVNTALYLGYPDPYNLTDEQFAKIKDALIEQKKLLLTYYAGNEEGATLFYENNIKASFAMGEIMKVMIEKKGGNVGMTIPKEGAIGWLDCWVISKGCKDIALAEQWIDFATRPEVGHYISETYMFGNTTDVAYNEQIGLTYADKLSWLQPPEDFQKRTQLWNEVKAAPV